MTEQQERLVEFRKGMMDEIANVMSATTTIGLWHLLQSAHKLKIKYRDYKTQGEFLEAATAHCKSSDANLLTGAEQFDMKESK